MRLSFVRLTKYRRMNLDVLLNTYLNGPRIFKIANGIVLSQPQKIHLTGLQGSASQFIISSIFNHSATSQLNHLITLRDAEDAASRLTACGRRSGARVFFYFPS